MSDPRLIDVCHLGRPRVIGAWLVDGFLVDPGPGSSVETLLEGLGDERPRAIALTHIHLDHAGATGSLVERWPELEVWVHERGAPHLVDPEKLLASATRLYGDDMDRLWGEMVPVPRDRLRILPGDTSAEHRVGPFRVHASPGHASHHLTWFHEDSGTAFTGDVAGVRVGAGSAFAPTPPPDIDLEAWRDSLDRLEAWGPDRVAPTHFGAHDDVAEHLASLRSYLDQWGRRARDMEQEEWIRAFLGWLREHTEPDALASSEQAAPPDQLWLGLRRYWSKRG